MSQLATKTLTATSDTRSILNALSATFTNTTTFVGELLQNARRAGATSIAITLADGYFEIADDGVGISDFRKLLSIAVSGWDESVQKADAPYGLGFMSVVYAAESIQVASGQTMFDATREQIVGLEEVSLVDLEDSVVGAVIRMKGITKSALELKAASERYARGFPLPVTINGEPVQREHAIDVLGMVNTRYGKASPDVALGARAGYFYLQGLPIKCEGRSYANAGVIHLDSTMFHGRMPDRNELCNADESNKMLHRLWRENALDELLALSKTMESREFITRYGGRLRALDAMDMLSSFDHLPGDWVSRFTETPRRRERNGYSGTQHFEDAISRDWIIENGIYAVTAESYGDDWKEMLVNHLLYANKKAVAECLPGGHWVSELVIDVKQEDVVLVPGNVIASETTDIHYNSITLVLVDSLHATLSTPVHGLPDSTPLPMAFDEDEGKLYFTEEGADETYALIYQVSNFVDGESESWDESAEQESYHRTLSTIRAMIHRDPASLLDAVLRNGLPWRTPDMLRSGSFQVKFDPDGTFSVSSGGDDPDEQIQADAVIVPA